METKNQNKFCVASVIITNSLPAASAGMAPSTRSRDAISLLPALPAGAAPLRIKSNLRLPTHLEVQQRTNNSD